MVSPGRDFDLIDYGSACKTPGSYGARARLISGERYGEFVRYSGGSRDHQGATAFDPMRTLANDDTGGRSCPTPAVRDTRRDGSIGW